MILANKDLRILNINIEEAVKFVTDYLRSQNLSIEDKRAINSDKFFIRAVNRSASPIKLLKAQEPQIVNCTLSKERDNQTKVEIWFDLFKISRFVLYGLLVILGIVMKIAGSFKKNVTEPPLILLFECIFLLVAMVLLFWVLIFLSRATSIKSGPEKYNEIIEKLYCGIRMRNGSNEIVIDKGTSFPDIDKLGIVFICLSAWVILGNTYLKELISEFSTNPVGIIFMGCLFGTLITLILILVSSFLKEELASRLLFSILGISIAMSFFLYCSIPIIHAFHVSKDLKEINSNLLCLIIYSVNNFGVLIISILITPALYLHIKIIKMLNSYKNPAPHSVYYKAIHQLPKHSLFSFLVVLVWVIISIGTVTEVFIVLSIFEKFVFSANYLFKSNIANIFIQDTNLVFTPIKSSFTETVVIYKPQAWMLFYSLPVVIMLSLIIEKNLKKTFVEYFKLKRTDEIFYTERIRIHQKLEKICKFAQTKVPLISIEDSEYINSRVDTLMMPLFKNIFKITTGAINKLEPKELEALLAHEIGHLKNNSGMKFMFLNFLSEWTLFGQGFLAVTQNSIKIENDADDFAIKWLEESSDSKTSKQALTSLLEKLSIYRAFDHVKCEVYSNTLSYSSLDWLTPELRRDVELYSQKDRLEKIKISIMVFYHLYFGERILSYFHPSFEERLNRIRYLKS